MKTARILSIVASLLMVLGIAALGFGPGRANASSHREAPLIASDPQADATDLYAFTSPDKPDTVTIIANYYPFEEPVGGPLDSSNHRRFLVDSKRAVVKARRHSIADESVDLADLEKSCLAEALFLGYLAQG